MKKLFVSAVVMLGGLLAMAQVVNVESISKVNLPAGTVALQSTVSPDGKFVVISDGSQLSLVDIASGQLAPIAKANSASDITISADGSQVAYIENVFKGNLRYRSLKSANLRTGKVTEVVKPSRKLNAGVAFSGNTLSAVENGKLRTKAFDNVKSQQAPVASINYGHLEVTVNGKTTAIDPQGRGSYLWPSVSPDGTRVAYWCTGRGCFVCDLDGSNVQAIGALRAAVWAGNNVLVGHLDHDNGEVTTDAAIIASDLNGNKQVLTDSSVIALDPSASANGKVVTFTGNGELYIINLK